jgi:cell division septal protein FtsQ
MYERTYHAKVLKTDSVPRASKRFPWKRVVVIVSVLAVLTGVVFFIRAPRWQVTQVLVEGTNVADPEDVSQKVLGSLEGNYLYLLPRTSIVLISTDQITDMIRAQFPRFKEVAVERDSMHSLKVSVVEYPGVYLWCDEACSFMDEKGTVFADAPYFSGSAYLKIYAGERQPYPFRPIEPELLAAITRIYERLQSIDIVPLSVKLDSEKTLAVSFIHYNTTALIYFDPTSDIDSALETLYTALRTAPLSRLYHSSTQVLEYLDARFGNKLVYKFQQ